MVQRCCVPLCDTKVGDVDVKGTKVRFHRIPLVPEKFMKWREQITNFGKYKPDPDLTINSRICSKHFSREDYIVEEAQKPGTAGNHVLAKDAVPTIFKWNDAGKATFSRAIPFVKKSELQNTLNGLSIPWKHQEIQCTIEEDRLKQELSRKNAVIRQLLQRLTELEGPPEDSNSGPDYPSRGQYKSQSKPESMESTVSLSPMPATPQSQSPSPPLQLQPQVNNTTTGPKLVLVEGTTNGSSNNSILNAVVPQRVSVIKRVCDVRQEELRRKQMPPKKRILNYFYDTL